MNNSRAGSSFNACGDTAKFFANTSRGVCAIQSDSDTVVYSEKLPSSKTNRNSAPSGASPWIECGIPVGKYQRSPSLTSATKLLPLASMAVRRAFPYSITAHSAAACQCNSRIPPAVSRILTPARDFEIGNSRTVTSRDQPPWCNRLWESENGYLNVGTEPASVAGGALESGFFTSRAALPGTGSFAVL